MGYCYSVSLSNVLFSFFHDTNSVLCCFCSLLKTYADYESNPLLRRGIEFCCRQFYILHRKPFILQLFASVAPLLEFTVRTLSFNDQYILIYGVITALLSIAFFFLQTRTSTGLSKGVSSQCLFDLLVSLEGETVDSLDALELVKAEKPLRSLGKMAHRAPGGYIA